jgi:hypothetical protein
MTIAPAVEKVTDFTIPEGCMLCGGDLPVRVTERGAQSVCKSCGWFAKPVLTVTHDGFKVSYSSIGSA